MKGLRFFIIGFVLSLVLGAGVNAGEKGLEEFLMTQVYFSPQVFLADIPERAVFPGSDFRVEAKSAIVLRLEKSGEQKIIFEQNSKAKMPIASLTKLMTAVISLENQPLSKKIEITQAMVSQEGNNGKLRVGEKIAVGELLEMALVESSNDAALALAEISGGENFINLMNLKAAEIGLRSTRFSDPTGLEAENNFSSARDMANLAIFILKEYPPNNNIFPFLETSSQSSVIVLSENGELRLKGLKIVGGKTGYTDEAGGCIILILKDKNNNYFINVILGADSRDSRFSEMRKLIDFISTLEI